MRTIEQTGQFKRDLKRVRKTWHRETLERDFLAVVKDLANDVSLTAKFRDHALVGRWRDHRDCHIKPDLVLIYRFLETNTLQLVRLGSHSELEL